MGMDFSALIYAPNFDQWARPITFNPVASQAGQPAFAARGIWHQDTLDLVLEDGSLYRDQQDSIDILEVEFPVLPQQLDRVVIPADNNIPAEGEFEVVSVTRNGGGETNLVLRKWVPPALRGETNLVLR
jgi:hypothetical protein